MNISLSAFAPENLVSRDGFGSLVPRQLYIILINILRTPPRALFVKGAGQWQGEVFCRSLSSLPGQEAREPKKCIFLVGG